MFAVYLFEKLKSLPCSNYLYVNIINSLSREKITLCLQVNLYLDIRGRLSTLNPQKNYI